METEIIFGSAWARASSRSVLERFIAGLIFVLALPAMLLAALLVKLSSRGPLLYTQTRLGLAGKPFQIYKFRTMYADCERTSGPCWSAPGDPRVTAIGRFLRRMHLDELPQLWNVLRGDMSLVGPRPERPEFVTVLKREVNNYERRLQVRPGITGLAQLRLPPDTDLTSVRRKLAYDLLYIRTATWWLDARIIACTALQLLAVSPKLSCRLFYVTARLPAAEGETNPELRDLVPA